MEYVLESRFDSILVRLKDPQTHAHHSTAQCFDSILVRLKVLRYVDSGQRASRFDSILVRLKVSGSRNTSYAIVVSIPYWFD